MASCLVFSYWGLLTEHQSDFFLPRWRGLLGFCRKQTFSCSVYLIEKSHSLIVLIATRYLSLFSFRQVLHTCPLSCTAHASTDSYPPMMVCCILIRFTRWNNYKIARYTPLFIFLSIKCRVFLSFPAQALTLTLLNLTQIIWEKKHEQINFPSNLSFENFR